MANARYIKGYNFETAIKKKLEKAGFYVCRSGGSKGVFDLLAVKNDLVLGIQCKYDGRIYEYEIKRTVKVAYECGITPVLAFSENRKHKFFFFTTGETKEVGEFLSEIEK